MESARPNRALSQQAVQRYGFLDGLLRHREVSPKRLHPETCVCYPPRNGVAACMAHAENRLECDFRAGDRFQFPYIQQTHVLTAGLQQPLLLEPPEQPAHRLHRKPEVA